MTMKKVKDPVDWGKWKDFRLQDIKEERSKLEEDVIGDSEDFKFEARSLVASIDTAIGNIEHFKPRAAVYSKSTAKEADKVLKSLNSLKAHLKKESGAKI